MGIYNQGMGFRIEPLSAGTYERTVSLVVRSFPDDDEQAIRKALSSSLERDNEDLREWLREKGCKTVSYWIAIEGVQVIGVTGLYAKSEDELEAYWLAWFCVDLMRRRQGLGWSLIQFSMDLAQSEGKRYLRLYTTTAPNEAAAQILYRKLGFKLTHTEPDPGTPYNLLHKELDLLAPRSILP
ncbi:hypothetical protein LCGC14_1584000 [marine sediment metagenome]|uniref:N-acetyltransferase domain-containing protein n=1 Tax=marine sediment metagenome TaxID=412755 RepID=A0A0F9IG39_9ZZZZ